MSKKDYTITDAKYSNDVNIDVSTTEKISTIYITINNKVTIIVKNDKEVSIREASALFSNPRLQYAYARIGNDVIDWFLNPNFETPASLELQEMTGLSAEELSTEKSLLLHSYGKIQFDKNIGIGKNNFSKSNLGDIK